MVRYRRTRVLAVLALLLGSMASFLIGAVTIAPIASAATPPGYVAGSALINGDSITTIDGITDSAGNPISLEQYAAQRAGFTVTVVDGTTWAAMAKADFAKYQLLIIGDPFCSVTPVSAVNSAPTWAPVVMGTSGLNSAVGNRTLIGTDPEWHFANGGGNANPSTPGDPSTAGAEHLVEDGIAYAGGVGGATGVYFDTSCGDPGGITDVLNSLSSTGAGFTQDNSPPCGGSVQLIASNPVFSSLRDTDIQGWGCSDHTTYPTFPADWQPLAVATDTATKPTCGTDPDLGTTACGEAYVLVAGQGIVVTAPDLSLTPPTDSAASGGSHTVTATVTQSGTPLSGQTVTFEVTGQNAGASGTCVPATCKTDATGKVTFTYSDGNGAGTDTINASVTIGATTEHATAAMVWTSEVGPPTANAQSVTTPQDTAKAITLTGSDPGGHSLTFAIGTGPAHGSLSGSGASQTYTPDAGYTGPDSFTFTVNNGSVTSAPATVSITVTSTACATSAPVLDATAVGNQRSGGSIISSQRLTTHSANELILAFVEADGPMAPTQTITGITGGGLSWTLASRANETWGTTEVWQAWATAPLSAIKVTATLGNTGYDGSITVASFTGAANPVGATGHNADVTHTPSATLTTTGCNSLVWAAGHDWSRNIRPVAVTGQSLVWTMLDPRVNDSFWTQKVDTPIGTPGSVTVADSNPTSGRWTMAAVEILAG